MLCSFTLTVKKYSRLGGGGMAQQQSAYLEIRETGEGAKDFLTSIVKFLKKKKKSSYAFHFQAKGHIVS